MKEQEIKFDGRNYRKHSDRNKALIKKSLEELGAGRSVVIDADDTLVAGNGVYEQAKKLKMPVRVVETDGTELVVVKRTDIHTEDEKRRKLALADNAASDLSEWDVPMIQTDWAKEALADWGVEFPEVVNDGMSADEIARKDAEFRERMAAGEISEEDEEYQEFCDKFKLKKTTDDCYTPELVYDAVADYVAKTYRVNRSNFVRPFYPGGDYQKEKYPKGCVVVDNPPFSILAEILQFYKEHNIAFFLFAPTLTLFSSSSSSSSCALPCGVAITYENGANVNTSFLTSFEADTIRLKACPELYAAVKTANKKNLAQNKKKKQKYEYPIEVVTAPKVAQYSRLGIEFLVPKNESVAVSRLDDQKQKGEAAIYGKGYFISERCRAERERVERERVERERVERERVERERVERWQLSDREKQIIKNLGK